MRSSVLSESLMMILEALLVDIFLLYNHGKTTHVADACDGSVIHRYELFTSRANYMWSLARCGFAGTGRRVIPPLLSLCFDEPDSTR